MYLCVFVLRINKITRFYFTYFFQPIVLYRGSISIIYQLFLFIPFFETNLFTFYENDFVCSVHVYSKLLK